MTQEQIGAVFAEYKVGRPSYTKVPGYGAAWTEHEWRRTAQATAYNDNLHFRRTVEARNYLRARRK
jgi:ABC-type transporter lipoprotein component MlaA